MTTPPRRPEAGQSQSRSAERAASAQTSGRPGDEENDTRRVLRERVEAARAAMEPPRVIGDAAAVAGLVRLLDGAADRIEALGPEPRFLGLCPHKFNDANHDDLWYAVRAGGTVWEQSQFFEHVSVPFVEERGRFTEHDGVEALQAEGATASSHQIAALRAELRALEEAGWRAAVDRAIHPPLNLLALVVERGQRWLVLETPNVQDAAIFAWDADGLFPVGTMKRIDDTLDHQRILTFATVEPEAVHRLGPRVRAYFHPDIVDGQSGRRLSGMLHDAAVAVRDATDVPVAMGSRQSRPSASVDLLTPGPRTYAEDLRPGEGELRAPRDGVWPPYRPPYGRGEVSPLSEMAKAFHRALGTLEKGGWRGLFEAAFGETLIDGQTLALFVDRESAVLMRDNAAFRVTPDTLEPMGVYPYPNLYKPGEAPVLT